MPQVTVYIREDDLEAWKALKKKSEFIHNALNRDVAVRVKHLDKQLTRVETMAVDNLEAGQLKPLKTPKDTRKAVEPKLPHKTYFKKGNK